MIKLIIHILLINFFILGILQSVAAGRTLSPDKGTSTFTHPANLPVPTSKGFKSLNTGLNLKNPFFNLEICGLIWLVLMSLF